MSEVLDRIREKYPAYADTPDDELTKAIGTKYPQYLDDEGFKGEFEKVVPPTRKTDLSGLKMPFQPGITSSTWNTPEGAPSLDKVPMAPTQEDLAKVEPPRIIELPGETEAELARQRYKQEHPDIAEKSDEELLSEKIQKASLTAEEMQALGVPKGIAGTVAPVERGLAKVAGTLGAPENAALIAGTVLMPETAPVAARYFGAQMAIGGAEATGKGIKQAIQAKTPAQREEAIQTITEGAGTLATLAAPTILRNAKLLPKAAAEAFRTLEGEDASKISKAAAVYGDVRPQQAPAEGLPQPESGAGVQPQAQVPQEGQARVLLTPEEQGHIDAEKGTTPFGVEVGQQHLGENEPFAAGTVATINRQTRKIVIIPEEFKQWLRSVPAKARRATVRAMLGEEANHLATTPEQAKRYWGLLTEAEKLAVIRKYTGKTSLAEAEAHHGRKFSDTDLGYEAVNHRMKQLARMSLRETVEATGREKWTVKTIDTLQRIVSRIMESLPTKASRERRAILRRVKANLEAARVAAGQATGAPASLRKSDENEGLEAVAATSAADFFDLSQSWAKRGMTGAGTGPQRTAEAAARSNPDLAAWEKAYADAAAEAKSIRDEIKADPSKIAERQKEMMGAGQKAQFFSEGIKELQKGEASPAALRKPSGEADNQAREKILALTSQADQAQKSGNKALATSLSGMAEGLKKQFPNWQEQSFPAALRKPKPPTEDELNSVRGISGGKEKVQKLPEAWKNYLGAKAYEAWKKRAALSQGSWGGLWNAPNTIRENIEKQLEAFGVSPMVKGQGEMDDAMDELLRDAAKSKGQGPAALRKKKADEGQLGFELPPMAGERPAAPALPKEPLATPAVKPPERPSAVEAGAQTAQGTAYEVDRHGYGVMQTATDDLAAGKRDKPIRFREYQQELQKKFDRMSEGAAFESYERNLDRRLFNASGEVLKAQADALGLKTPSVIADPPPRRATGQAATLRVPSGSLPGLAEEARAEREMAAEARKTGIGRQRARNYTIQKIRESLLGEAGKQMEPLKTSVGPEDIRRPEEGIETKEPTFWDITAQDLKSPKVLGDRLAQDSRRSRTDPVSKTKRLTVVVDKTTGKTFMVDTYPHGRTGAMLLDPSVKGLRAHRSLEEIMQRYRPVASVLLDSPVKDFRQEFKTLGDFESKFGTDARRIAEPVYGEALEVPSEGRFMGGRRTGELSEETGIEGAPRLFGEKAKTSSRESELARGEGEEAAAPTAETPTEGARTAIPGMFQTKPGTLQAGKPLTDTEAGALLEHVYNEVSVVDSPQDFHDAITALNVAAAEKRLTNRDRQVISALDKMVDSTKRRYPKLTDNQAIDQTLEELYEFAKNARPNQELEDFVGKAMERFGPETPKTLQREPGVSGQTATATGATGLPAETLAGFSRRARPSPPGAGPEAKLPIPTPAERLPGAPESPPLQPLGASGFTPPPIGKPIGPITEYGKPPPAQPGAPLRAGLPAQPPGSYEAGIGGARTPASLNKKIAKTIKEGREDVVGQLARTAIAVNSLVDRRDINRLLPATLDGAEAVANNSGERSQEHVQMPTHNNPKLLQAANAMHASGFIAADFPMDAAAADRFREILDANGLYQSILKQKGPTGKPMRPTQKQRALIAKIEAEAKTHLISEGLVDVTKGTYSYEDAAKPNLDEFERSVNSGAAAAENAIARRRAPGQGRIEYLREKYANQRRLREAKNLLEEVQRARDTWDDPKLRETALIIRQEYDRMYAREKENGSRIRYTPGYLPGRYEGEFFNDGAIRFPGVIGTNYRKAKTFPTAYDAIEAGPYISITRDASAIVGHRVRQGERSIQRKAWINNIKRLVDEVSGEPVMVNAEMQPDGTAAVPSSLPSAAEYSVVHYQGRSFAIRKGYASLFNNLTGDSKVQEVTPARKLLEYEQRLKHTILVGDLFHVARLGYYTLSILGGRTIGAYGRGKALLKFTPENIDRAVAEGLISKESADFAKAKIPVNFSPGRAPAMVSRMRIARMFEHEGLGVGKIQDALYKDLIRHTPFVGEMLDQTLGRANRWIFDSFTRQLMLDTAVQEFERVTKENPNIRARQLMRDVSLDLNRFYGSIGRQSWFNRQGKTWQDAARIVLLAPQWQEGLVMKEAGLYKRLGGAALRGVGLPGGRQGLPPLGVLGRGMARGLFTMMLVTQAMNLILKRKPTWQNEENDEGLGQKFDAWIPAIDPNLEGFRFSPMGLFNEITHDIIRLGETKDNYLDAIEQIGNNKLSPFGRAALVGYTGIGPTGQKATTSMGRIAQAGKQLIPAPISFGRASQEVLSRAGIGSPPPPGSVQRQAIATAGFKVEPIASAATRMQAKAKEFMRRNGLEKTTGWQQQQTYEDPSYTKLRAALRMGDTKEAGRIYDAISQKRTPAQIRKAMKIWAKYPFTGSKETEELFKSTLIGTPDYDLYFRANVERQEMMNKYDEFLMQKR